MRNVLEYNKITKDELKDELVFITSALSAAHSDLAATLADQQMDYLDAYARSPGNSVASKNREAQYATTEQTRHIIELRAQINSLMLVRDLAILLLGGIPPNPLPFPTIADMDGEGLAYA